MQVLGIDVGGSGIKGSIVDIQKGELLSERIRIDTPLPATPVAIADTINEIAKSLGWKGKIGCGFPAVIINGVAKTAANVDESWVHIDAKKLFSEHTNCDVSVINDADAAGLAEMKFGAGKDKNGVVLMLTVGTGIGSALFLNGKLIPNTEYGHFYYKDVVAEKYCSDLVRKKNDLTWEVWTNRFCNYLRHLERVCNPDIFIIGGGLSKKSDKFVQYLDIITTVKIAELENNAGIIGAALSAT